MVIGGENQGLFGIGGLLRPYRRLANYAPAFVVVLAVIAAGCIAPAPNTPVLLSVDTSTALGPTNNALWGFNFHDGEEVCDLDPGVMRLDARLGTVAPDPDSLEMEALLQKVATARQGCAEPMVILSYMPAWLASSGGLDPGVNPPVDLDRWEELIVEVVTALATADQPALTFEVWNEPDLFLFWGGTAEQFLQLAIRTHRAVHTVETNTGLDLKIGGPGAALSGTDLTGRYLHAIEAEGLPLDFVSWHSYPNLLLGPDGEEFTDNPISNAVYPLISGINPWMSPESHRSQIRHQRSLVENVFGEERAKQIDFGITEWNMSSGGFDLRNDTSDAAAWVASSLTVFEEEGLDLAAFFRSGSSGHVGDWGVVNPDGSHPPKWDAFRAFTETQGTRVAVSGAASGEGVYARATIEPERTDVIVSSFLAHGPSRTDRELLIDDLPAGDVSVQAINPGAEGMAEVDFEVSTKGDGSIAVSTDLLAQSVVWITVTED